MSCRCGLQIERCDAGEQSTPSAQTLGGRAPARSSSRAPFPLPGGGADAREYIVPGSGSQDDAVEWPFVQQLPQQQSRRPSMIDYFAAILALDYIGSSRRRGVPRRLAMIIIYITILARTCPNDASASGVAPA